MAVIRITRELLEFALDLPEGLEIVGGQPCAVEGVPCFTFVTSGESDQLPAEGTFALQYEETEQGLQLVSVVPVT